MRRQAGAAAPLSCPEGACILPCAAGESRATVVLRLQEAYSVPFTLKSERIPNEEMDAGERQGGRERDGSFWKHPGFHPSDVLR